VRIAPQMVEDLHWASASVETIGGLVVSSWTRSERETTLDVTIPINSDAEVVIPEDPQSAMITLHETGGRYGKTADSLPAMRVYRTFVNQDVSSQ
jgi:hypothetical protein